MPPLTSTLRARSQRRVWFVDYDGVDTRIKHHESVVTDTFDFTEDLGADTISSVTWDAEGVTITNPSNTTTTATITVADTGEATITITTTGGLTLERRYRWLDNSQTPRDYREFIF